MSPLAGAAKAVPPAIIVVTATVTTAVAAVNHRPVVRGSVISFSPLSGGASAERLVARSADVIDERLWA